MRWGEVRVSEKARERTMESLLKREGEAKGMGEVRDTIGLFCKWGLAFAMLVVFSSPALHGQVSVLKTPNEIEAQLKTFNATSTCSGTRYMGFDGDKIGGKKLRFRIYIWHGDDIWASVADGANYFRLYDVTGGTKQEQKNPFITSLNVFSNYKAVPGTKWRCFETEVDAGVFQPSHNYELENTMNVFHIGYLDIATSGAATNPATTQFEMQQELTGYDSNSLKKLTYRYQARLESGWKTLTGTTLEICAHDSVLVNVNVLDAGGAPMPNDRFTYTWNGDGGVGVRYPQAVESYVYKVTSGATLQVKRTGMCDIVAEGDKLTLTAVEGLVPTLQGNGYLCDENEKLKLHLVGAKGAEVSWQVRYPGAAPGSFNDYSAKVPTKVAATDDETYDIPLEYGTNTGTISYELRATAKIGACELSSVKEVKMYPQFKQPKIKLEPEQAGLDLTKPVCSPLKLVRATDEGNLTLPTGNIDYEWSFNGEKRNNQRIVENLPEFSASLQGATEEVEVSLKITVVDQVNCFKEEVVKITLMPTTPAQGIVHFYDAAGVETQSRCTPIKIEAENTAQVPAGSAGNLPPKYEWNYLYEGDLDPAGKPKVVSWGNTNKVTAPETVPGTGMYYFREYKSNPAKPYESILRLTYTNEFGCSATKDFMLGLQPAPEVVRVDLDKATGCSPLKLTATAVDVERGGQFEWTVLDGATPVSVNSSGGSVGTMPTTAKMSQVWRDFEVANLGAKKNFTVRFKVRHPESTCTASAEKEVEISPEVKLTLDYKDLTICPAKTGVAELKLKDETAYPTGVAHKWYIQYIDNPPVASAVITPATAPTGELIFSAENQNTDKSREGVIKLVADEGGVCQTEKELRFTVYPRVDPQIKVAKNNADGTALVDNGKYCAPFDGHFEGDGATDLYWHFEAKSLGAMQTFQNKVGGVEIPMVNVGDNPENVRLSLVGANEYQCTDSVQVVYTINPSVALDFSVTTLEKCNPVKVRLTRHVQGGKGLAHGKFKWDGTPNAINYATPGDPIEVEFTTPGKQQITLLLVGGATPQGCPVAPKTREIDVPQPLVAKIDFIGAKNICGGLGSPVEFTNASSGGATKFEWDFGDGSPKKYTTDPAGKVSHVFRNTGNIPIVRSISVRAIHDDTGCEDVNDGTDVLELTVYPEPSPRFDVKMLNECEPRKVRVEDNGSTGCGRYEVSFMTASVGATPVTKDPWAGITNKEYDLPNTSETVTAKYTAIVQGFKDWPGGLTCKSDEITLVKDIEVLPRFNSNWEIPLQACGGDPVEMSANSGVATGILYDWSFEGGPYQQLPSPVTYRFVNDQKSTRTATVKVRSRRTTDGAGACASEKKFEVLVRPRVEARILLEYGDRCTFPTPIVVKNTSQCAEPNSAETLFTWSYASAGGTTFIEDIKTLDSRRWTLQPESTSEVTKYTVTLSASQKYTHNGKELTCASALPASIPVEIYPELKPKFTLTPTQGCAPLEIKATDQSEGGKELRQEWNFGDGGGTLAGKTVDYTYQNASEHPRTLKVTLRVSNDYGCTKTAPAQNVTVYPQVQAAFNLVEPSPACPPYDLTFVNISKNAMTFEWNCLAGGAPGFPQTTVAPAPVRIENPTDQEKTYTFRLTARSDYGGVGGTCSASVEKSITVRPELKIEATPLEAEGCNPLEVAFSGKVIGGDTNVPFWDFGDGTTYNSTDVVKEFTNNSRDQDAVYTGKVVATRGVCKAELPVKVTVYPKVEAMFGSSTTQGCSPLEVKISDVVTSAKYSYSWSAEGSDKPLSNDPNPGRFRYVNSLDPMAVLKKKLKLTVKLTDHPQCEVFMELPVEVFPGIKPSFTIDPGACSPFTPNVQNETQSMSGQVPKYTWKFYTGGEKTLELTGEQPNLQLTNPSHEVEQKYEVWLIAWSEQGCGDSVMHEVSVWPKPLASLELEGANESCPPYNAKFINKSLGSDLTFTYTFGDGKVEQRTDLSSVTHTYDNLTRATQAFSMKLKAENKFGCSDEKETTITIFSNPKADFTIKEGYAGCSPFLVSMEDKSNNAKSYKWTFGDGKESIMPSPIHQFENKASTDAVYDVTVRVETVDGCADEFTRQVTVYATPNAEFSVDPPLQVFTAPAVEVDIADLTKPTSPSWKYEWDFGNGQTSTVHNPGVYEYTNWALRDNGFAYTVRLKVSSPECESSYSKQVFVLAPVPNTEFSALDYADCAPFDLRLTNETNREYMDSCYWDFGDGEFSREFNPIHRYETPGLYHVSLKAWGEGGENSAYRIVEVYDNPKPQFELLPKNVMLPSARVKANNLTEGAAESFWDFGDGHTSTEHSPVHEYTDPGEYTVRLRVKSQQGCEGDTVVSPAVVVQGAGYIRFPSAFVPSTTGPNGGRYSEYDRENKVFHPVWRGVVRYKLMIFNRWGEKLFESNDINIGWDGYFGGKVCMTGVYAWRAVGEYYNGEMFYLRGNVTLLR